MEDRAFHTRSFEEVAGALGSHPEHGLSQAEVETRQRRFGANELTERPRPIFLARLRDQLDNYLVLLLIAAALVTLVLGEYVDAVAIAGIVVLNALIGIVRESKAEQALTALKHMVVPTAHVIRDGRRLAIPTRELVPGDLVALEAGNYVPADVRLVSSVALKIDEASLTGESVPVEKNAGLVLEQALPLGDRRNCAFSGTLIMHGRGTGLVTGIGMGTEIGRIAEMIQSSEEEDTPLQQKLERLGKVLATLCIIICGVVFAYGLVRDTDLRSLIDRGPLAYLVTEREQIIHLFMVAVSLAVAAVPEGLPAIVTICLALGMQQMVKRHVLIRKLPAVETLGCATVVCSDKTGTLTQNQMTVVQAWAGGQRLTITGEGYSPRGQFFVDGHLVDPRTNVDVAMLLQGGLLCNDARLEERRDTTGARSWQVVGDPTEGAIVVAAAKAGFRQDEIERGLPRVREIPFDSDRKRMTTIHRHDGPAGLPAGVGDPHLVAFVKGAPDIILDLCQRIQRGGRAVPLTEAQHREILAQSRDMAGSALRVLGVAYRPLATVPDSPRPDDIESQLIFVGLLGMIDPPRPQVVAAVRTAREAGLKSIMVTGDHKETAEAIALAIGLRTQDGVVLAGSEIEQLSDVELAARIDTLDVCCRVSPHHKTRIVEALKARNHVVAMTGDGVNDAPALRRAHIGIAMGITGTDVTKQTAHMILTDDNFASIVAAIEQGRIIYSNIRKFVYFLLACNAGEVLIILGAMLAGLPMPLRPVQLLWLNLVSDAAPALALGMEHGERDIMKHPPRPPTEPVIDRHMAVGITVVALVDTLAILTVFWIGLQRHPGRLDIAQSIAFVTLCTSELIRAFPARSEHQGVFSIGLFANRWMIGAVGFSFLLVLLVVYVPVLQPFFHTVPLSAVDWLLMLPFVFASPVAMEVVKVFFRRPARGRPA